MKLTDNFIAIRVCVPTVVQYAGLMGAPLAPPQTAPAVTTATPTSSTEKTTTKQATKEPKKSSTAKEEQTKMKKKAGGGEEGERSVDVSRLDMRVGRVLKAWKHPDADGLYVEEGQP